MTAKTFVKLLTASLLGLALSACAAPPAQETVGGDDPAGGKCDASSLGWAVGKVADDALVERARAESGSTSVRMLRPGVMVTREFNAARLNIRVDNDRKVLSTSCG